MRRAILVVLLFVFSVGAALALNESELFDVATEMKQAAGRNFDISVHPAQEMNACAYPDGRIMVTQGMLDALDRHDQLAFVLGHEMTHVIKRHGYGQVKRVLLGAILAGLAAKALGADGDTVRTAAEVGGSLNGARRSRKDEFAADAGGIVLAHKAGYDPAGAIEAMRLLQSRYGNGMARAPIIGWFASHPDTGERIRHLEKAAAALPPRPDLAPAPAVVPDQPLPEWDARPELAPTAPAPVEEAEPAVEPVVEDGPREADPGQPEQGVIQEPDPAPVPAKPVPVPEDPPNPDELRLNMGASFVWKMKAPVGTETVKFEFTGEDGQIFKTSDCPSNLFLGMMVRDLAGHGKVTMTTIALDANGRELARNQKYLVIE